MSYKRYWIALSAVTVLSFFVVGYLGKEIYQQVPPIPKEVVSENGQVLYTQEDIEKGQAVWQSTGGQELGTIWGHGSYLAPDWSADWIHRQAVELLNKWSLAEHKKGFDELSLEVQASLKARLQKIIRTNTYNPTTGKVVVSTDVAASIKTVAHYYQNLFGDAPEFHKLRNQYSMMENTVASVENRHALTGFLFWAAWACQTNRPGHDISYTSNWPSERLVGNTAPGVLLMSSIMSVVLLLAGIGIMVWYYAVHLKSGYKDEILPPKPVFAAPTPSMIATKKYFLVVALLLFAQVLFGVITAHYTVEGNAFFGIRTGEFLPYSISRTWHVQLAMFWIATALLGTGLYIAPMISGYEPPFQRFGVNFLWCCLLVIVSGSMVGEWLGVKQFLSLKMNFWFGHQGYQYVDLGRFWQSFLMIGLVVWLVLMVRALMPALRSKGQDRGLLFLFCIAAFTIAAFYGAGFMWGEHTNLAIVEYWRWWVVHLWVEGIFEIFTTTAVAFLLVNLGLLERHKATKTVLLATCIYSFGGIIGLFHHLYFTATPQAVIVLGGIFSALEVVPLTLMGIEAYHNYQLSKSAPWVATYKWPIYFFIAVSFWNLLGAGLLGFLINMPSALYHLQGLNTTPLHAHAALFGVYGNLSIGLLLFCMSSFINTRETLQIEKFISWAFWLLNIGIAGMCFLSLMPVGLYQAWTSITYDMWYARSELFTAQEIVHTFIWMRAFGDVLFGLGSLILVGVVLKIMCGSRAKKALS